jgi:hypothetical protein
MKEIFRENTILYSQCTLENALSSELVISTQITVEMNAECVCFSSKLVFMIVRIDMIHDHLYYTRG